MNKQQLASLIWDTCNDLRGSISAVEYKDIILGLIFYRFVSEKEVTEIEEKLKWTPALISEELTEEDGKIIPFALLQQHLFSEDFARLNVLDAELADITADRDAFWDELDEELKDLLKKKEPNGEDKNGLKPDTKIIKENYQAILALLSDETTQKLEEYLLLTPKQKLAFQSDHAQLPWPPEAEKSANGTYNKTVIRATIETVKNGIELPEDEDAYKIRYLHLLNQRISALKKQVKDLKLSPDNKARAAIKTLSEDEIRLLLKEKWLTPAMQDINNIPVSLKNTLYLRLHALEERYRDPLSVLGRESAEAERELLLCLKGLGGDSYDTAAIGGLKKLLGE